MRVGFVVTNFNNSSFTENLVKSISLNTNYTKSIVVIVDNNSSSDDKALLKEVKNNYPEIVLIFNKQNVGYFKGLNIGLEYLKENYSDLNHIIVGNNDLFFPDDFIDKIINNKDLFEKYPVVSPDIISLDGIHQNPHVIGDISWIRNRIYDIYYSNYYLSVFISSAVKLFGTFFRRKDHFNHQKSQLITQGYGACYILGPIFFERFNLLWAPTFLMGEEFFLSKQLERKGFKVYYTPSFKVFHHDHATMGKLPSKRLWMISKDSHLEYRKYL